MKNARFEDGRKCMRNDDWYLLQKTKQRNILRYETLKQ